MEKTSTTKELREKIKSLSSAHSPRLIKELIDIATHPQTPTALKIQSIRAALPFLLPTLERLELTDGDGESLNLIQNNVHIQQALMLDPAARELLENAIIRAAQHRRGERGLPQSGAPKALNSADPKPEGENV